MSHRKQRNEQHWLVQPILPIFLFCATSLLLYMQGGRLPCPPRTLPSFLRSFSSDPPWVGVLAALHDFCLKNTAHNKRCSIIAAAAKATASMRNGPGDNYSPRTREAMITHHHHPQLQRGTLAFTAASDNPCWSFPSLLHPPTFLPIPSPITQTKNSLLLAVLGISKFLFF